MKLNPYRTNAWHHASGTWEFDRFPQTVLQWFSDYKNFSLLFSPLPAIRNKSEHEKILNILMWMKGVIALGRQKEKLNKVKIRWERFMQIRKPCQIPACLSHELIESKIEYGIEI